MEDGVLISPAPYSAPAAYFPHGEQNAIFRNIKGGSQIQYGPYHRRCYQHGFSNSKTFSGRVTASIGSFNTKKTYVNIGDEHKTMDTY
jgi:Fe(3+) dicitrate transport protein